MHTNNTYSQVSDSCVLSPLSYNNNNKRGSEGKKSARGKVANGSEKQKTHTQKRSNH